MPITLITPPAEEPVTLAEAKIQCQVDADLTHEDALITGLIAAAREFVESFTGRPLITQTQQYIGLFSSPVELTPNLKSVAWVKYKDVGGVEQTVPNTDYYASTATIVGLIHPFKAWPGVQANHPQPVTIQFTAGYGGAADVPESIKTVIKILIDHWYNDRASIGKVNTDLQFTVESLLQQHRVVRI